MVRVAATQALPNANASPRYEFVHAMYREVFYQRQAPGRCARLHRRVGEQLEALFSERLSDAAPDLADHFEKAADWARAIKYLRLAADRAGKRYAHRDATVLLQQALGLAGKLSDADRAATETEILQTLEYHRELSRATIFKLANLPPAKEPLRRTFLSAPVFRSVIAGAD
jgi:predicted ATPase